MRPEPATFTTQVTETCPACRGLAALALVVRLPGPDALEVHAFHCDTCGPTKSRIVTPARNGFGWYVLGPEALGALRQ